MHTPGAKPVFVADTCIGGLSVVKALWRQGATGHAVFMADYVANPLGVKSDAEIAAVAERWLRFARRHSETLVIACNTLSIRYHQLFGSTAAPKGMRQVVTMLDCLKAMAEAEAERLAANKVLVVGTAFTASQALYPDTLQSILPGTQVATVAATELERRIARFQPVDSSGTSVLTMELRQAIENTDVAILACTCFPMVKDMLQGQFPGVVFLDPGAYCTGLLQETVKTQDRFLEVQVEGDVVSRERVIEFARSYLGTGGKVS
jgi:glutamate racemase